MLYERSVGKWYIGLGYAQYRVERMKGQCFRRSVVVRRLWLSHGVDCGSWPGYFLGRACASCRGYNVALALRECTG